MVKQYVCEKCGTIYDRMLIGWPQFCSLECARNFDRPSAVMPSPAPDKRAHVMVFDTNRGSETAWDKSLQPRGEGTFNKERFGPWWKRNEASLAHLHPMIAEQWIYKHWSWSPYKHLPIASLCWQQEKWSTERILADVYVREGFGKLNPASDYKCFRDTDFEPGLTMDATGTWNYPIVVLQTPNGIRTESGRVNPSVRYCLIEGHQRVRYLNALKFYGAAAAEHLLFVLNSGATAAPIA
jgi:hypothetical protein